LLRLWHLYGERRAGDALKVETRTSVIEWPVGLIWQGVRKG
jgi:hypothetical protein